MSKLTPRRPRGKGKRIDGIRKYRQRRVDTRQPLPLAILVCDDRLTAPKYFDELKRAVKQFITIRIKSAGRHGESPQGVVDRSITENKNLADREDDPDDRVWAVFDVEGEGHEINAAEQQRERARSEGICTAASYPCFELWTLLHLQDTGETFDNCSQVKRQLKAHWKKEFGQTFDDKTKVDFSKILSNRQLAADRAEQHWNRTDPSRTEVFRIIRFIDSVIEDRKSECQ